MAQPIMLAGFSGSGKSSSLKTLKPEETFIISCTPKQLSIPGFRKNYKKLTKDASGNYTGNWYFSNEFSKVMNIMKVIDKKMPNIKTLVIDDTNYLLSQEVMDRAFEKGYDKHTEIANHYYNLFMSAMTLRDDLIVVFISHIVNDGNEMDPKYKLFTTGKMLDRSVNVDGLFNYIIYAEKLVEDEDNIEYKFRTRSNGPDTCRSTEGCFDEKYVDPDMQMVIDTIRKFEYGE